MLFNQKASFVTPFNKNSGRSIFNYLARPLDLCISQKPKYWFLVSCFQELYCSISLCSKLVFPFSGLLVNVSGEQPIILQSVLWLKRWTYLTPKIQGGVYSPTGSIKRLTRKPIHQLLAVSPITTRKMTMFKKLTTTAYWILWASCSAWTSIIQCLHSAQLLVLILRWIRDLINLIRSTQNGQWRNAREKRKTQ